MAILDTILTLRHRAQVEGEWRILTRIRMHPLIEQRVLEETRAYARQSLAMPDGNNYLFGLRIETDPELNPEEIYVE